jgi:hypothetical protein
MRALASQQLLGLYGPAGKLGRPLLSAAGTRACETAVRCPLAAAAARALGNSLPSAAANSSSINTISSQQTGGTAAYTKQQRHCAASGLKTAS